MPKLTEALEKSRRCIDKFTNYRDIPWLKQNPRFATLRDQVSAKGEGKVDAPCLQEMSLMLVCLQKHEFNEALCNKEIGKFNTCMADFKTGLENKKQMAQKGIIVREKGKLPSKHVNNYLRKFPHPRKDQ